MDKTTEEMLRKKLEENFPNDKERDIDEKVSNLIEICYKKRVALYIADFRGIVLRVGLTSIENNQNYWYSTEAGLEVEELLKK